MLLFRKQLVHFVAEDQHLSALDGLRALSLLWVFSLHAMLLMTWNVETQQRLPGTFFDEVKLSWWAQLPLHGNTGGFFIGSSDGELIGGNSANNFDRKNQKFERNGYKYYKGHWWCISRCLAHVIHTYINCFVAAPGMDSFFVLSGLLISRGYQKVQSNSILERYGIFLLRRFCRIWPMVCAAVLASLLIAGMGFSKFWAKCLKMFSTRDRTA